MLFILSIMLLAPIQADDFSWPEPCDTCETVAEIKKVTNALNPLLEPLEKYLQEHQLENEHQALNKVLFDMGVEVAVAEGLPSQAFILQHQKITIKNLEKQVINALSKESKEITEQMKNYVATTISNELKKSTEQIKNYVATTISNELKKTSEKMDEQRTTLELYINKNLEVKFEELKNWLRPPPFDCLDIFRSGEKKSGVYTIHPKGQEIEVFCDMESEGGGWTVFFRRQKQTPQLIFRRLWEDYKNGFGSPSGEYWMGNEALHLMTSSKNYSMRLEATSSEASPTDIWSYFSTIIVDSEEQKYQLTLEGRNKDSTNHHDWNLSYNSGMKFTTIDQDNDGTSYKNCAEHPYDGGDGGGFWYDGCSYIDPTRPYGKIRFNGWSTEDPNFRFASTMKMMIRRTKK